jgi:hypothetical protein
MNLRAAFVALLLPTAAMAAAQAFPPTAPGVNELKTLPAGTLLKAARTGNYFAESGGLFRPLFNYISSRDIKMTVPVEAQIDEAAMYFWVAPDEVPKVTGPAGGVEVIRMPARQVAARGDRGGYATSCWLGWPSNQAWKPPGPPTRYIGTAPSPPGC